MQCAEAIAVSFIGIFKPTGKPKINLNLRRLNRIRGSDAQQFLAYERFKFHFFNR